MGTRKDFTIRRPDGRIERTVVGKDGQVHPVPARKGKDGQWLGGKHGHFADEWEYRRAIDQAAADNRQPDNRQSGNRIFAVGPLEFDSFGLLPADGFGRLSSEDY